MSVSVVLSGQTVAEDSCTGGGRMEKQTRGDEDALQTNWPGDIVAAKGTVTTLTSERNPAYDLLMMVPLLLRMMLLFCVGVCGS